MVTLTIVQERLADPVAAASPVKLQGGASTGSKLASSTSGLAVHAMNWAAWEYRVSVGRRTQEWRMSVRKVPGTRVQIWSSSDVEHQSRGGMYEAGLITSFEYNRGQRVTWNKTLSVSPVYFPMSWQQQYQLIEKMHLRIEQMLLGNHDRYEPKLTAWQPEGYFTFEFKERNLVGTWRDRWPKIDGAALPSDTSSPEHPGSARITSFKTHGRR